jgi:hypothetical protein
MNLFELHKISHLFDYLDRYKKTTRYKFRGQSDSSWPLIPKAGRPSFARHNDKEIFKQWKRRGLSYLENSSFTDSELLTIAQHTGLPTRLLDWSFNPLVAAYFACQENHDKDGAIFAYKSGLISIQDYPDPFSFKTGSIYMLQPNSSHSRLVSQHGYFTLHTEPTIEIEQDELNVNLDKIIIPRNLKKEFIFRLNQMGFNHMTIFPDLEGLSKHLCWFYENFDYWTEQTIE